MRRWAIADVIAAVEACASTRDCCSCCQARACLLAFDEAMESEDGRLAFDERWRVIQRRLLTGSPFRVDTLF